MSIAEGLAVLLTALMALQALLGLLLSQAYRDVEWIKATWYGNDWITLVVVVPLMLFGLRPATRGHLRGTLLVLGVAAYGIYNYAFYLFGATLNAFFPLYAAGVLLGIAVLGVGISRLDASVVGRAFREGTPVRLIGGYLVFVAAGLALVWLGMWAVYAFAGLPTPIEPEAFKVVAALDLCLLVPGLASGGVLLWRRRPWGYVIASIAAIQGSLYLGVLSVNSAIAIRRGLVAPPGELPLWGPLAILTTSAAVVLITSVSRAATPAQPAAEQRNRRRVMAPFEPRREDGSRAVLFTQGIITLIVAVLAAAALDDITTDNATRFVPEYWILAAAGAWDVFVAYKLVRRNHGVVGTMSVAAVGAAAWVAFDGLGHRRDGGWSTFWPEYSVMLLTSLWFIALSVILLALSRRAVKDARLSPS